MFGVAVAFAPNFTVYVILRFVVGATISGVIINAFVLGTNKTQIHTEKQTMMSCDSSYSSSCTMINKDSDRCSYSLVHVYVTVRGRGNTMQILIYVSWRQW